MSLLVSLLNIFLTFFQKKTYETQPKVKSKKNQEEKIKNASHLFMYITTNGKNAAKNSSVCVWVVIAFFLSIFSGLHSQGTGCNNRKQNSTNMSHKWWISIVALWTQTHAFTNSNTPKHHVLGSVLGKGIWWMKSSATSETHVSYLPKIKFSNDLFVIEGNSE